MFYQIFRSAQVKQCAIIMIMHDDAIIYEHGM